MAVFICATIIPRKNVSHLNYLTNHANLFSVNDCEYKCVECSKEYKAYREKCMKIKDAIFFSKFLDSRVLNDTFLLNFHLKTFSV